MASPYIAKLEYNKQESFVNRFFWRSEINISVNDSDRAFSFQFIHHLADIS